MMQDKQLTVGLAVTGSFGTFAKIKEVTKQLAEENIRIIPIYSLHVQKMDTRFGTAEEFRADLEKITGEKYDTAGGADRAERISGRIDYRALHRKYAGEALCRDYGYACADGGKGASSQ